MIVKNRYYIVIFGLKYYFSSNIRKIHMDQKTLAVYVTHYFFDFLWPEFRTADSKEYYFNEVPPNSICTLRFRVKTGHDAHICLTSSAAQDAEPILEIFLGGWDNKMSAIRKDRASTDKVKNNGNTECCNCII